MAYGFQIYDKNNKLEYDSSETINGGVFYKQFVLPATGSYDEWKEIRFDNLQSPNSSINTEISTQAEKEFKNKTIYYIILIQGVHQIRTGIVSQDLNNFWPKLEYRRPSNITDRSASTLLVFIR